MYKFDKAIKRILFAAVVLVCGAYIFLYFAVPKILCSGMMVKKYENLISNKLGFPVIIKDFKFRTRPNLSFGLKVGEIASENGEVHIRNIKYYTKILSVKPQKFAANKIKKKKKI